jgi:predicted lipoprotein
MTIKPNRVPARLVAAARTASAGFLGLVLTSCGAGTAPPDAGVDTLAARKREILGHLGETIFLPTYRELATAAAALESATAAFEADPSDDHRAAAQQTWRDAMALWQQAELFQLGPAGASGDMGVIGGRDLRSEVYAFPLTNACRVDQETVAADFEDPDVFATELVNVRGLGALEYLLFVEGTSNACTELSPINAEGTWAALGEAEIRARRSRYAHTVAVLVRRQADALVEAWSPEGGDFVGALASAGESGSIYPTARRALNDLVGGMLYLDTMTKDMKLGEPAGLVRCTAETCPEELETRWARVGKENVLTNLRAFERIFLGASPDTDAPGLDDLLIEIGAEGLADRLRVAIASAITAVEAVPGALEDAISTDRAALQAAFDAIAQVVMLFKMELVTTLDIELPSNFGDND